MQKNSGVCITLVIPLLEIPHAVTSSLRQVAGLPLIRRVVMMASQAGFEHIRVIIPTEDQAVAQALQHTQACLHLSTALDIQCHDAPTLLLAPDCMPEAVFFRSLAETSVEPNGLLLWNGEQAMLIGSALSSMLTRALRDSNGFSQLLAAFTTANADDAITVKRMDMFAGTLMQTSEDCRAVERALLSGLVKQTDGWLAQNINRKASLFITKYLMHTSIKPNQMTWLSMTIGVLAAVFFTSPDYPMQVWGGLLFLAHSILDGCDGELARLKFMSSRLGGVLDFWSDNIVHVAVFSAMGVGWMAQSPDSNWPWLCASLAVGGTAVSASLVYFHTMHSKSESETGPLYTSVSTSSQKSTIVRIADMLSRRDFIYLVLLLALLNQTHWFLIMTAMGAPIYALLLMVITRRE